MQLSKRLNRVAEFVTPGYTVVDVGTDHGYIPIYLVKNQIATSAIAMDINKGPLERALAHIKEEKLESYITVRLSDGLAKLNPGEAESLVIAGMGGSLIIKILSEGQHVISGFKEMILSPQSEIDQVRTYLLKHGFIINEEDMLKDDGKFYTIMKVQPGHMSFDQTIYFKYGKYLLEHRNPVLEEFLNREYEKYKALYSRLETMQSNHVQRLEEIAEELKWMEEALLFYKE